MKRRQFVHSTASSLVVPFILPSKVWADPPSKKLAHASIGVGGMQGGADLGAIASTGLVEIVALCDVDKNHLDAAGQAHSSAKKFQDFRELFASMADKFDSVNIAVPDHMHGIIALTALRHKKHVYCQKPLAHTVAEARAMRDEAKNAGVVTQMGNQVQSDSTYRTAVKMVKDGVIGTVKEIRTWCSSGFHKSGRPETPDPVPAQLDWDKWLGIAHVRPYKNGVYHPVEWRGWQEFGSGTLGDFCCHIMDSPFKALDLTAPTSLVAEAPEDWAQNAKINREVWPVWEKITYEFPGTAFTEKSLKFTWTSNAQAPSTEGVPLDEGRKLPPSGALFMGDKGTMLLPHVARPQLLPYAADRAHKHETVAGNPQEHYTTFVKACLGLDDAKTTSHFDFAAPLVEAGLLGLIGLRFPGQKLHWDVAQRAFTNHEEANKFLEVRYRDGWKIA